MKKLIFIFVFAITMSVQAGYTKLAKCEIESMMGLQEVELIIGDGGGPYLAMNVAGQYSQYFIFDLVKDAMGDPAYNAVTEEDGFEIKYSGSEVYTYFYMNFMNGNGKIFQRLLPSTGCLNSGNPNLCLAYNVRLFNCQKLGYVPGLF